jgi:hypothetical protein
MMLTLVASTAFANSALASSVCIVSEFQSATICDGQSSPISGSGFQGLSLALKSLTDHGYKVVSQSDSGGYMVWTLTKD